jgi:methylmalonyl-CoA mutase N-terminal domain/subunit
MKEHYHASDPKSWKLRFHIQTGGFTLTAQQPDNNIVHVTLQALVIPPSIIQDFIYFQLPFNTCP